MLANTIRNGRPPFGRDLATFADAVENARAPFSQDFETLADETRNVPEPSNRDVWMHANAIRNVRAPFGRYLSTLAGAICKVRAAVCQDFSIFRHAIRIAQAPFGGALSTLTSQRFPERSERVVARLPMRFHSPFGQRSYNCALRFFICARTPFGFSYVSLLLPFISPYMLPLFLRLEVIHLRAASFH